MSYSFSIRKSSKDAAKVAVTEELAQILARQPSHVADIATVEKASGEFIDALENDAERDVSVTAYGSIGTMNDKPYHISVNLVVELVAKS